MKVEIPGTSFQRDTNSMALLQTNKYIIDEYTLKRKIINKNKELNEEMIDLKKEVSSLKETLNEIKQLLKGLNK